MPGAIISRISADGNPLQCRWVLAPHSKELHSWSAQFRPCALSHRGASACSFLAYELRGPDRTRSLRSARELDLRARWRNTTNAVPVLSQFANHKGANNHKDKPVVCSDDEDDDGGGRSTSWRATPDTGTERHQQHLSPSSPDDRVPRCGLAVLVATGATRPTKTTPPALPLPPSSPMSFSAAIEKAKAAGEAEKVRDEGGQQAHGATFQLLEAAAR